MEAGGGVERHDGLEGAREVREGGLVCAGGGGGAGGGGAGGAAATGEGGGDGDGSGGFAGEDPAPGDVELANGGLFIGGAVFGGVLGDKVLDEGLEGRVVSRRADLGATYGTGVLGGGARGGGGVVAEGGEPRLGAGAAVRVQAVEERDGVVEEIRTDLGSVSECRRGGGEYETEGGV